MFTIFSGQCAPPVKYENRFHTNKIIEAFLTISKQDITTLPVIILPESEYQRANRMYHFYRRKP